VIAAAIYETHRHEVTICARRPLPALRLELEDKRNIEVPIRAFTAPDAIDQPADWVMLAVKANQTAGAASWLEKLCGPASALVVLQNGVEHGTHVEGMAHGATVLPATVWIDAEVLRPGDVRLVHRSAITVPASPTGDGLVKLLAGSWLEVRTTTDFLTESWRKLCFNAATSLQALADQDSGMFVREDIHRLVRALAAECAAVGRAEGAALPEDMADQVADRLATLPRQSRASILLDRRAGRPLEWDARNGVIQRLGAQHGIATPISDVVVPLLAAASSRG
jgi:2-dehydropantoate 2-reductase